MSRSQQIRDALAGAGDVHFDTIMMALNAPAEDAAKVRNILSALRTSGEIVSGAEPETFREGALKGKTTSSKPTGSRSAPNVDRKKLRDIAAKAKEPPDESMSGLAVANLLAAGDLLRATLIEQVTGLDENPMIKSALALHESAERLVRAAA